MNDRLTTWKARIVELGLFVIFLVLFGTFVWSEIGPIIRPLFG